MFVIVSRRGARGRKVTVGSLAEASAVCRAYCDRHGIGFTAWTGGRITDNRGKLLARVSYNGKVWPPDEWSPGVEPMYNPW